LIFVIFVILQILSNENLLPSFKKINLKIFFPLLISISLIYSLTINTNLFNNINKNFRTSFEFANNILLNRDEVSKAIKYGGEVLQDNQRLCLTLTNISHIEATFPQGTGLGLKSYQNSLKKNNLGCKNRSENTSAIYIRAHNLYISYLAEMGIFFIPFFIFLISKLRNKNSTFIILGLLVGFLGHEYLTSPYTWMIFGLSERLNYD